MKKIAILYSGGLDSFIMKKLAEEKNYNPKLIYYNIGQDYSEKELLAIKESGYDVDIRKVGWLDSKHGAFEKQNSNSGKIFIPGRNMVLASLAASTELADEIWMGGLKGEDHKKATDKNKEFINRINNLWSYVYSPFDVIPKLVFPLIDENWGKFEAVEWVYKNGKATIEDILKTSSCLSGTKSKNCGHCVVCCRRKYIFMQLGFEEIYDNDPLTGEDNLRMIIEMLETPPNISDDLVHYDRWRRREILPGLYMEFGTDNHETLIKIMQKKMNRIKNG